MCGLIRSSIGQNKGGIEISVDFVSKWSFLELGDWHCHFHTVLLLTLDWAQHETWSSSGMSAEVKLRTRVWVRSLTSLEIQTHDVYPEAAPNCWNDIPTSGSLLFTDAASNGFLITSEYVSSTWAASWELELFDVDNWRLSITDNADCFLALTVSRPWSVEMFSTCCQLCNRTWASHWWRLLISQTVLAWRSWCWHDDMRSYDWRDWTESWNWSL